MCNNPQTLASATELPHSHTNKCNKPSRAFRIYRYIYVHVHMYCTYTYLEQYINYKDCAYFTYMYLPIRGLRGSGWSKNSQRRPIKCSLSLSALTMASTSHVNSSQDRWGYLRILTKCFMYITAYSYRLYNFLKSWKINNSYSKMIRYE